MAGKNYYAQLSPQQKAELFKIYSDGGYMSLSDIINDYNNRMIDDEKIEEEDLNNEVVEDTEDSLYDIYGDDSDTDISDLSALFSEKIANSFSEGGGIHIKPENRGKFTELKKRTGHSSTWFKEHGTPAQKKMAVFALNAAKWHDDGGNLFEDGGDFVDARVQYLDKFGNYKKQVEIPYKYNDLSNIKTTGNRPYNEEYINYIDDGLKNRGFDSPQRQALLANIVEESGGDPYSDSRTGFKGLLQWSKDRYWPEDGDNVYSELEKQLDYIADTVRSKDTRKSWNKGYSGSGYGKAIQARNKFNNAMTLEDAIHALTWGYIRPAGKEKSYKNRLKVAKQIDKNIFN